MHFSAYIAADGSESSIGPMEEELRGRRPGTAPAPSVQMNVPRGRPADSVEGSASPSARAGSAGRHHRGPSKERTVSLSLQVLTKDTLAINVEKSKVSVTLSSSFITCIKFDFSRFDSFWPPFCSLL